jgi:hypothetical protein
MPFFDSSTTQADIDRCAANPKFTDVVLANDVKLSTVLNIPATVTTVQVDCSIPVEILNALEQVKDVKTIVILGEVTATMIDTLPARFRKENIETYSNVNCLNPEIKNALNKRSGHLQENVNHSAPVLTQQQVRRNANTPAFTEQLNPVITHYPLNILPQHQHNASSTTLSRNILMARPELMIPLITTPALSPYFFRSGSDNLFFIHPQFPTVTPRINSRETEFVNELEKIDAARQLLNLASGNHHNANMSQLSHMESDPS